MPIGKNNIFRRLHRYARLKSIKRKYGMGQHARIAETHTGISVVVPCYNVERYVDDLLSTIFSQSVIPDGLEVILVDDGSTDATVSVVRQWSRQFPRNITLVLQGHKGPAAARNLGIKYATKEWIMFPDSDDFLHLDYFRHVLDAINCWSNPRKLTFVSCNIVLFRERDARYHNRHPLRYKYIDRSSIRIAEDLNDYIQLSAASAWFCRDIIDDYELSFNESIKPAFEDGEFVNRYLISCGDTCALFLQEAIYYYRKRADSTSRLDKSFATKEAYLDQLEKGYLGLLMWAAGRRGSAPAFIQRTVLYDVIWKIRRIVDRDDRISHLSSSERQRFLSLLREVFTYIDTEIIEEFDVARFYEEHRVGILHLCKGENRSALRLYVGDYDKARRALECHYFHGEADPAVELRVNGKSARVLFRATKERRVAGMTYVYRHGLSVPFDAGDVLTVHSGSERGVIKRGPAVLGHTVSFETAMAGKAESPAAFRQNA